MDSSKVLSPTEGMERTRNNLSDHSRETSISSQERLCLPFRFNEMDYDQEPAREDYMKRRRAKKAIWNGWGGALASRTPHFALCGSLCRAYFLENVLFF